MPATFFVTLQLDAPAPQNIGPGLHAILHELIHRQSPEQAAALHQSQLLPLSLGWARYRGFGGVLGRDGKTVQFRVQMLDEDWVTLLRTALTPGTLLGRYQQKRGRIVGQIVGLSERTQDFEGLAQPAQLELPVEFVSPTLLRSGESFLDRPRADVLLHGLLRRTRPFSPYGDHIEAWAWANETQIELETIRHIRVPHPKLRGQDVNAFVGRASLLFPNIEAANTLSPVMRLAQWTGTGIKTLYGFGETISLDD